MDVLTSMERTDGDATWHLAPGIDQGICQALAAGVRLLLYCPDTCRDTEETLAALDLYRRAGGRPDLVAAATAYPSGDWVELLRAVGVNHIFLAKKSLAPYDRAVPPGGLREIVGAVCRHLHARQVGGGPVSVCGMRFDCLVLGDREYSRWCLADWHACPYIRAAALRTLSAAACAAT